MLGQRRRRWIDIETTFAQCLVLAGKVCEGQTTVSADFSSDPLQQPAFAQGRRTSAVSILGKRCTRWPNIQAALGHELTAISHLTPSSLTPIQNGGQVFRDRGQLNWFPTTI